MSDDLLRDLRELPPPLDIPYDFYDRIMATVRRRRRARRAASAAVALVVAFAGIVVGLNVSSDSATERIVPITPSPSSGPVTSPSPAPTPTLSTQPRITPTPALPTGLIPLSVSFVSPQLGWAYGPDQGPSGFPAAAPGALSVTHDGGQHWTALPAPHLSYGAAGGATSVTFIDADRGYLYGDGLFATADGGLHWRRLAAPGSVSHLAVAGNRLYAMAMTCAPSAPLCGSYDLYAGNLDGTDFVQAGPVTRTADARLATFGSRVFILWSSIDDLSPEPHLNFSTSGDGQAWSTHGTPCAATGADDGSIAAFSESGIALVCGSSASAGIQAKTVYESTDFGAQWPQRSSDSALPEAGYVGPLVAADAHTWVLAEQRGGLMVTHDGGATWQAASEARLGQGTDGWNQVVFADPQHAVAVPSSFYAGGLLISSDAGDAWSAITFPP